MKRSDFLKGGVLATLGGIVGLPVGASDEEAAKQEERRACSICGGPMRFQQVRKRSPHTLEGYTDQYLFCVDDECENSRAEYYRRSDIGPDPEDDLTDEEYRRRLRQTEEGE